MPPKFEWDLGNLLKSELKHNISAFEAESVFADPKMVVFFDPKHSKEEYRYICIGKSYLNQILFASFTFREVDLLRVISIRKANKKETAIYESYR
jgi:uncharacterized DUF497 family protein